MGRGNLPVFTWAGEVRAEAYIDMGDKTLNEQLFDELFADREDLEQRFGEKLTWERLDNRRASRVCAARVAPDFDDEESVAAATQWAAERLLRLHDVFDARMRDRAKALRASVGVAVGDSVAVEDLANAGLSEDGPGQL